MLTAEQRFHFDLKGWLKLENAIPAPEVAQYNALLERLERTPSEKMPQTWVPSRTPVIDELRKLDLDDLSPRQVLDLLRRWQERTGRA